MKACLLASLFLLVGSLASFGQVVTTTADAGPGSLRRAIVMANAGHGDGEIVFNIPTSDAGFNSARGVFVFQLQSELPTLTRSHLIINGASQTAFTGNTNSVPLGSGGTVGTSELPLPHVDGPEIELVGQAGLKYGFRIAAEHVRIQRLAILGFGQPSQSRMGSIVITPDGSGAWIEGNCLGSFADRTDDPGEGLRTEGSNIVGVQADSVTVKNNLLLWAGVAGIYTTDYADDWWIEGNEISNNNQVEDRLDGIDLAVSQGSTVVGNRITDNGGNGIDTHRSIGWHTIENNTILNNGVKGVETSGVRLYGLNNVAMNNVIAENAGAGILVTSAATKNTLSQNAIYDNGSAPASTSPAIGIDLLSATENHERGTAPYRTLNDPADQDDGGNGLLNYPVIDQARVQGDSVFIAGWTTPGSTVEFFVGDHSARTAPQGKRYLFSLVEGSAADNDATHTGYDAPGTWGTDSAARFAIGLLRPDNLAEGAALIATATLHESTSEFGPKVILTEDQLVPIAGCLRQNGDGQYELSLGYHNYTQDTIEVALGAENYVSLGNSVLPTRFYPGTHLDVATVAWDGTEAQWMLLHRALSLTTALDQCPTDIGITLVATESLVHPGDTVWVTATAENFSSIVNHEVTASMLLPAHATLLQAIASQGAYQASTGEWTIGTMTTNDPATLAFQLIINENTLVEGTIQAGSQPDLNPANDQAVAHIAIDQSSSGEDGGTESNGNLASKIAVRNFHRQQQDTYTARQQAPDVFSHADVRSGAIAKASARASNARTQATHDDLLLIPEHSTESNRAVVVTPADLIGITNADELFSVDYLNNHDQRVGAILYLRTQGQVYEHTKAICDRLNGGALTDVRHVYIQGKPFILSRIDQPSGDIDYAINFVAYETQNQYTVDNRWRNEEYQPSEGASVLNFQVWSVSPTHTVELVEELLTSMQQQRTTRFLNQYPSAIPGVYVSSGYYAQGQLHLTLRNTVLAHQADVWGTIAVTEDGERAPFLTSVPLEAGEHQLSLPISQVFDAGFTLANSATGGLDALYLADGPWGVDYERDGADVATFSTTPSTTQAREDEYRLERSARMEGQVRTYASLFKSLRPGLLPQDMQSYRYLSFQASGAGRYEVIVTKESIHRTAEQFRYRFELDENIQQFVIPFAELANRYGEQQGNFTAEDVTSVVFNALGEGKHYEPFALHVEHLAFQADDYGLSTRSSEWLSDHVTVYPNPAHNQLTVLVTHQPAGEKVEVTLLDLTGRSLQTIGQGAIGADGRWQYDTNVELSPGIYLLKVATSRSQSIIKFVKQ